VLLIDEKSLEKNGGERGACEVVFPPCDTKAMRGFGLEKRSNEIISLAQFRYVLFVFRLDQFIFGVEVQADGDQC